MKKVLLTLTLCSILAAACKKHYPLAPQGQPSILGEWRVTSISTYNYDATGLRDSSLYSYSGPNSDKYTFDFNNDHSWTELFSVSPQDPLHVAANGIYSITSDTSFTLMYPSASITRMNEPCKIQSLTNVLFIFSKQLPTVFNGTDPGYIKYVFRLSR